MQIRAKTRESLEEKNKYCNSEDYFMKHFTKSGLHKSVFGGNTKKQRKPSRAAALNEIARRDAEFKKMMLRKIDSAWDSSDLRLEVKRGIIDFMERKGFSGEAVSFVQGRLDGCQPSEFNDVAKELFRAAFSEVMKKQG